MLQSRVAVLVVCAALTILSATPTLAQTSPGRISGTVRDANGVALPGATITVINQETGTTARVVTSLATGAYEAANLQPGLYTVSADLMGFRKVIQRDRQLAAGATLTVDLTLELKTAEAVTVTAMKREETVFSTPISVAAPTEDVLRERGVDSLEGVAANVADFSVQNLGPGQSTIALRGTSAGQIARDQPGVKEEVGAYLDESVISLSLFTPDMDLFDMNRVEVLRGPQGTLFGSGAVSGTVRYISNQPELGISKTFGETEVTEIDGGEPGTSAKLGFNAPLGDKAAARIVGYSTRTGGYMDAVQPNLRIDQNVNGNTRAGLRAAIRLQPSSKFSITPRLVYQRAKADGWNRIDAYNILANPRSEE